MATAPAQCNQKSGPNERCGCGSGRKFKKCCRDAAGLLAAALDRHTDLDLSRAAEIYEAALAAGAGASALHGLGVVAHQQGDAPRAAKFLRRAAAARPDSAVIQHSLGVALESSGEWAHAVAAFQAAAKQDPRSTASLLHLGAALRQTGDLEAAADCLARVAAAGTATPAELHQASNTLGAIRQQQGRHEEAAACFRRAVELAPHSAEARSNLGGALRMLGQFPAAVAELERAVELNPQRPATRYNLGLACKSLGRLDAAREHFADALRLDPAHENAEYFLKVLDGATAPAATPARLVADLFDGYAERFDDHLQGELGYRIPAFLRRVYDASDASAHAAEPPQPSLDILDLGCGTGLAGVAFHDLARHLAGVDLAPRMIEKARARGIYQQLAVTDVNSALQAEPARWDLILAADVFVYIGDLESVFALARTALRPRGNFLFSVETGAGESYLLSSAGRFQHPPAYLQRLAATYGFETIARHAADIRLEGGQPVPGEIYLLRKPE